MTDARPHEDDENQTAEQPVWAKPPTTNDAFSHSEELGSGAAGGDEAPRYAPPPQFSAPPSGQAPPPAPTWARPPEAAQGGYASPGAGFADPSGRPGSQSGPGPSYPAPTQPTPAYATPAYANPGYSAPGYPQNAGQGQNPGPGQNAGQGQNPGPGQNPAPNPAQNPGASQYLARTQPVQYPSHYPAQYPGQSDQPVDLSLDQPAAGGSASGSSAFGGSGSGGSASGDYYAWGGHPSSSGPGSGPGTARTRRGGAFLALLVAGSLVAGALGGVAGAALLDDLNDSNGRNPTITLPEPAKDTTPAGAVTKVADAVLPSVVSIQVRSSSEEGTGSGFVIDAGNGYILTNNHVVTAGGSAPATDIRVVFQDGTQVPGKVVGLDASYDLAVVKVAAKGLRTLALGDSDAVRVGDPVIAIGAPLGLQGTVTTGIVSALNRPVAAGDSNAPAFINAIQTDAAINPGNSGGPLVDSTGKVIGINSAIARSPGSTSDTGGNIGLGFSIPSNQARRTAQQLIRTGKAEHPIIGVTLDSDYNGEGVKVSEQPVNGNPPVTPGGPAAKAGIQAGDVITKFNGRPVTESDELIVAIRARTPGETITLTVRRAGNTKEVGVKLSASSD